MKHIGSEKRKGNEKDQQQQRELTIKVQEDVTFGRIASKIYSRTSELQDETNVLVGKNGLDVNSLF